MIHRTLLVYLNESDFESASTSIDWNLLIKSHDATILLIHLNLGNDKDFREGIKDGLYTDIVTHTNPEVLPNIFLRVFKDIINSTHERLIQIISHGNSQKLAIKSLSPQTMQQTFIEYQTLNQLIGNNSKVYMNMMTVCQSHESKLQDANLLFLATTEAKSVTTEAISDSCKLYHIIDKHGFSVEEIERELSGSKNQYHFSVNNKPNPNS